MKNNKKLIFFSWSIFILLLITSNLNAEIIENNNYFDEVITINPSNPTGENGWYINPVEVTFHAHDPPIGSSGLYCIKYRINTIDDGGVSVWQTHYIDHFCTDYDFSISINIDGIYVVEFYAIDGYLAGMPFNEGAIHSSQQIKIDMTKPVFSITNPLEGFIYFNGNSIFETRSEKTIVIGDLTIEVTGDDITSGIYYVHFDIAGYESDDTSEP